MTQSKYEELYHHGIKGQKWGIRRFQNEDGTRTAAGKARERKLAGAGTLSKENNTEAANNYKSAKKEESLAYKEWIRKAKNNELTTEQDDEYDKKTTELTEKRKAAFEKSKAEFKANKTTGQKVANLLVNGPIGAGVYNNVRAQGGTVTKAYAVSTVSALLGGPIGQMVAYEITKNR